MHARVTIECDSSKAHEQSESIGDRWDYSPLVVRYPDRECHPLVLPLLSASRSSNPPPQALMTSDVPFRQCICISFTYFVFSWNVQAHEAHVGLFVWLYLH